VDILNRTYNIQILVGSEDKKEKLRIYLLQEQQGIKERIASVGNNMNSLIRISAIGLLQYLQLLYFPSELDIDKQIQQVTLYFYCMQYQYHPVIPTERVIIGKHNLGRIPGYSSNPSFNIFMVHEIINISLNLIENYTVEIINNIYYFG
jgi:hypothetical protein